MDEQRLNELNAMRDSIAGGETAYNAIRFNSTQEAPIPYDRFTNFINQATQIEEQRDNSWAATKFVKAFANGFLIAPLRGVWGNIEASADANLIKQLDDEELAKLPGVEKVTRETIDARFPMIERLNVQADSTVGQYVYALTEGIGQMLGQFVVNKALGPIGGGAAMFSQNQGNQYADLRQQGVGPDKAFKYSMGNAAIQSALEQLSFGRLFKALPKDSTTRQKVKEVMEGVITEGFTEFLQDVPEKLSNYGALQDNEGKSTFETALSIAREWDSNYIDNLKDMIYSGSIGAIIGGGAKGLQIAMNKAAEKYILKDNISKIEAEAKAAKEQGFSTQKTQRVIDMLTGGTGAINLDAEKVREFAYNQSVSLDALANDLGTTKEAIDNAADLGLDITVSQGAMVANYNNNGFGQAMREHMSFGDQGKSLNYYQLQQDLEKTYGDASELQQSLKTELDAIEQSMLDAGIPQEQAKQTRALANAWAISMSPENPAAFLKKYQVRFSDEVQSGKALFQTAYNSDTVSPYGITQVNATNADKVNMIAQSMEENGYDGRPIVVMENADEYIGLTGSHRIDAAKQAGIDVEIVSVENNDDTVRLLDARDDYELADIAEELYNDGQISKEAYSLLISEKEYNQLTEGKTKGSFSPKSDGTYVINMFKGRDASTVIHETGHYFFEVFMQESGLEDASPKLKKDRAAFLNYVGMTEEQWQAADFEGRRAAHERVATAFEQYLLEGKAPSKGLRGVFARFSKWLKAIYGEVVNSDDYAGLTEDVRDAFDHWLAADADIEAAMKTRGMYGKLDGKLTSVLSDKQRVWLENQIEGARQKAAEILTKEYMSNFSSERKAAILQFRADIEPEVREQIAGLRVSQARANIADLFTQDVEIKLKYMLMSDQQVVYTEQRIGKPIRIANNYLNWLGQDKSREQAYKSVINEIDACLKPELTVLEQGFGNGVRWAYIDNKTGQEISFNEAQSRDRANPGYKYKPVSKNALWYQEWFAEHDRQPTKKDLLKLAEDLYCGIDKYKVYGDLLEVKSAKQKAEMDDYVKEHRKKLNELYAERDKLIADDKYLGKKRPKLSDEAALAFENLAEELGYSSGSEMAQDILNAKTEERMVQDAISARVKEKFPDYATERALREQATLKALYDQDEGGMVAALEQQLIEEAAQKAFDRELTAQENAAKMKERMAKAQEAKVQAEIEARKLMLNMSMNEALNAHRFAMQERRAAANAKKAMKKGDTQAASDYKHQQMVLHALVRHSLVLKQEVEKTKKFVKKLKKMKKEKFGNDVNFDQVMYLLYRLGVIRYDQKNIEHYKRQLEQYNPANHTLSLQEYVEQMTEKLGEGIPEIADIVLDENSNIKSNSMSIEQYEQVRDSIYNLYAIVQGDIKSTLDKQAEDFKQQKTDIKDAMKNSKTVYTPDIGGVDQESKKTRLLAERVSLDTFLNKMDDWTDGYFTKKWGGALKKCADVEATLKMEYDEAINAALKKWCPTREAMRAASEKINYEELGGSADKHTLINMLVQFGNESSMERLCATRPEGAENSKLWVIAGENNNYTQAEAIKMTRENIINFLSRVLTKSDVEYAQAKIDAVNKLWPLLAEVNRRTKGFAPKKVEATPIAFKPKDGDYMTFRGGYYPLARDSRMGSRPQGSDALSGTEDGYMPQKTMSTVQSTSKGRTGAKYPVKLNLGYELSIIDDTIHDIAYRETMMAFNKLLSDKEMSGFLKSKLGVEYFNLLKETLWKCARPRGGHDTVMAERVLSDTGAWIKKKMVNAVIALNLKVAAQNYGNIFLYGNAVDGFDYADVIATMPDIFSGLKKHKEMRDHCMSLSPFMRERAKAPDFTMKQLRESTEAYELAKLASGKANKAIDAVDWVEENFQKFGAKLLEVTDNTTAIPIWERAYHKKIDQGATQQEAIDFADSIIRRTLGSTRIQDVASVQRGSSIYNLFTAFQGFFNTQFNQWYREYKIDKKLFSEKEYKKAFMRASMFVLSKWILACLANTVIASLSFVKPFEEDKKGWTDYEKELITYPIAMLTGPIGQAGMAIIQPALGMESYGYRMSIVENFVTKAGATAYKAANVARGKKDASELTEPVLEIVSIMLGVPLQFIRTGGNFYDWIENDMSIELEDILTRRRKSERDR